MKEELRAERVELVISYLSVFFYDKQEMIFNDFLLNLFFAIYIATSKIG